ncbi:hypothetical protein D3C86_1738980 [compost metagenome]
MHKIRFCVVLRHPEISQNLHQLTLDIVRNGIVEFPDFASHHAQQSFFHPFLEVEILPVEQHGLHVTLPKSGIIIRNGHFRNHIIRVMQ